MILQPPQTSFTGGEISPLVLGRADLKKYGEAVQELKNMVVRQQGGLFKRTGTQDLGAILDTSKAFRLVDFNPTVDSPYQLEFGDYTVRVRKNGVLVKITAIAGNPDPYTITTPFPVAELYNLTFCVSVDDLIIYHQNYATQVLARNAVHANDEDWSIAAFNFVDGPYLPPDQSGTLLTVASPTVILKLTSNAAFGSLTVGNYIEYQKNNQWYLGQILGTGSTPAAPANPTTSTVYIQPVTSIVRNVDPAAVMSLNNMGGGVYELRSTIRVFNYSLAGSYIRFLDTNNSNAITWCYCSQYSGLKNYSPVAPIVNPTTKIQLTAGHTYQITAFTSGSITVTSGGYVANTLGESFTLGAGYSLSSPVMTLLDITTLNQYDCMAVNAAVSVTSIAANVSEFTYTNTATVTSSAAVFNSTTDVGRFLRMTLGSGTSTTVISMKITAVASSTSCTVAPLTTIPYAVNSPNILNNGVAALGKWRLGAFYTGNYPGCGTIYEKRHIAGGTPSDPEVAFISQTDLFNSFAPTDEAGAVQDTSAFTASVPSGSLTRIRWISNAINLLLGAEASENQLRPSYITMTLSPTNFRVSPDTNYGSLYRPIRVGSSLVFIQRSGLALKQLQNNQEVDGFDADDIQLIAEHIFRTHGGVKDFAYQQYPNSVLWFAMNDGALCGLTYNKKENVFAFHQHQLGYDPIAGTGALVETLCVSPGQSGKVDTLYLGVNRDGARRVEVLSPDFNPANNQDKQAMVFLDNYTYQAANGTPISSVSGLSRFNGQKVGIVIDGTAFAPQTVSSGSITLPRSSSANGWVYVGYNYLSYVRTLPIAKELPGGTTLAKNASIKTLLVHFTNTLECRYGQDLNSLQLEEFRQLSDAMDTSPPLFSSVPTKPFAIALDTQRNPTYYLASTLPYPLNILMIVPNVDIEKE